MHESVPAGTWVMILWGASYSIYTLHLYICWRLGALFLRVTLRSYEVHLRDLFMWLSAQPVRVTSHYIYVPSCSSSLSLSAIIPNFAECGFRVRLWGFFRLGLAQSGEGSVFAQLNTACTGEVVVVRVPAGVTMSVPLHVLALSSSAAAASQLAASYARLVVVAEAGSSVEVRALHPRPACTDSGAGELGGRWLVVEQRWSCSGSPDFGWLHKASVKGFLRDDTYYCSPSSLLPTTRRVPTDVLI